jgi:plastocyanin
MFMTPDSVSPGATVSVMNMDDEAHTVTSDAKAGTAAVFELKVAAGTTATFTVPAAPGTYPFHCAFHSNMQGSLVVR